MSERNHLEFEISIDPEFEKLIPPPTEPEFAGLEAAILRDGCTDPLIVWKEHGILLDGHNRKKICDQFDVSYKTRELTFDSRNDVKRWIIERQFGRRNLTPFQRAELALLLKPMLAEEAKKRQGTRTDLQKDNIPMNSWECSFDARKKKKLAEIWSDPTSSFDTKRYMADTASQQFGREYARHQRELASQVYIAASDSKIKVGISYEPLERIKELSTSEPSIHLITSFPGNRSIESATIKHFSEFSAGGEWFILKDGLIDAICEFVKRESDRQNESSFLIAKQANVSQDTIAKAEFISCHADEAIKEKLRKGDTSINAEYRRLKKETSRSEKAERKAAPIAIPDDEKMRLEICDVAEGASHIEPESIDFIITDPPYPEKYLPVFGKLADFAAHALKPGGSLICMSGQSYLPEVFRLLNQNPALRYHWTLAYLTPGGQATQLWERKVNTFWKPLLWFVKGDYSADWIGDVVKSAPNDNDKNHHHWGQSVSGMRDLLDRFVLPGKTVCDPFLGGGTTAIAARQCNCRFVGFDIDEKCLETTRQRLAELATEENHG